MANYDAYADPLRGWSMVYTYADQTTGRANLIVLYKLQQDNDPNSPIIGQMQFKASDLYFAVENGDNNPLDYTNINSITIFERVSGAPIAKWLRSDYTDMPNMFVNNTGNSGANYPDWPSFVSVLASLLQNDYIN